MITLTYNPETGQVVHNYPDGYKSITDVNPDDAYHAERLGITDKEHRLMHEAAHQLVGHYFRDNVFFNDGVGNKLKSPYGCPIIYLDMRKLSLMERNASNLEWVITTVTYHAFGKVYNADAFGALRDLVLKGGDPYKISRRLRDILYLAHQKVEKSYITEFLLFGTV